MTLARTPYARLSPADIGQVDRELKKLEQMSAGLYVPKVLVAARSPYTVQGTDTMLLCDCTAGAITLTFPLAARVEGMSVQVVKSDTSANAVTLSGTFSGVTNPTITVAHAGFTVVAMNGVYHVTALVTYPIVTTETGVTSIVYPYIDIRRFGAKCDGVTDDTLAVRRTVAAAAATANGTDVYVPDGLTTRITDTITVATDGVQIVGGKSGKRQARILFDPPATGAECFKWEKAAGLQVLYQCGIKNLMIQAAATSARVKTAMHLRNCSEFELDQVNIFEFTDASFSSVGVLMEGRELSRWRNFSVRADNAFHVKVCPDGSAIDFDHQTFENCYFSCDAGNTNTCFLIDPAVVVTNLAIRAFALVGFNNGIYWAAAPSNANSGVITIDGFRAEQATVATGYSIYLGAVSGTPRMVTIENARLDPGRHGIYLRGLEQVVLNQIAFENNAGKTAIDIDGTCTNVRWNNFFTQAGSVASVASNLQYLTRGPKRLSGSPIPTDAVLQSTSVTEPPVFQVGALAGGGLNTQAGIQFNVATATATTIVTLPDIQCTYVVSCVFRGTPSTTAYGLAFVLCTGGGVYTVVNLGAGIWSFSTVGAALKVTQASGGSLDCDWQISRYVYSRV